MVVVSFFQYHQCFTELRWKEIEVFISGIRKEKERANVSSRKFDI